MKYLSLILALLLLLGALASCSTGNDPVTSESTGAPDEPTEEGGTDPAEPDGETDPTDPAETTAGGSGTSYDPTNNPADQPPEDEDEDDDHETEAETEEEAVLVSLTAKETTYTPKAVFYWEGDFGSSIGAEGMLSTYAPTLPVISYSEDLSLNIGKNGEVVHIKLIGSDFGPAGVECGPDLEGLSELASGIYYVLIAVSWNNGSEFGYEYAFALSCGLPIYIFDGEDQISPAAVPVLKSVYNAESDAWTIETFTETLDSVKNSAPTVSVSDALQLVLLAPHAETSVLVYDTDMKPAPIFLNDVSEIYSAIRTGSWYIVIRVTWTGEYIESFDQYETEVFDYVVKISLS